MRIPRLLIQPLVENAVYHGIEKLRGSGDILLSAKIKQDKLIITVMDSGPGMKNSELDALNRKLSMDNDLYFKSLGNEPRKSIELKM